MNKPIGRNDPCPCGSGKKYKNCCIEAARPPGKRKFTAKIISSGSNVPHPGVVNLMDRAFGHGLSESADGIAHFPVKSQKKLSFLVAKDETFKHGIDSDENKNP